MNVFKLIRELIFPYYIEWKRRQGKMIFVFGSNEAGVHGAGAARFARMYHGAVYGEGQGRKGDSYAIPTKDIEIKTLPLKAVKLYIDRFIAYARKRPTLQFQVTAIGCGLAGFTHEQIAPLFINAPENCWFDLLWKPILGEDKKYWGTFQNGYYRYTPEYEAAITVA